MLQCAAQSADSLNDNDYHFQTLQKIIKENLPEGVTPTFEQTRVAPHILHLQMPPYDGAVITGLLSEHCVAVSPGSACMAEAKTPSAALKALNIKNPFSVLRLSFSRTNTVEECREFCKILKDVLKQY